MAFKTNIASIILNEKADYECFYLIIIMKITIIALFYQKGSHIYVLKI